jgi:hypothetical protein
MSKHISLSESEYTESEDATTVLSDDNIKERKKERKNPLKIENLTEDQYEKINDILNDTRVKGITKKGHLRKSYTISDKKKQHMEKLVAMQKEKKEQRLLKLERKEQEEDRRIADLKIAKLYEEKIQLLENENKKAKERRNRKNEQKKQIKKPHHVKKQETETEFTETEPEKSNKKPIERVEQYKPFFNIIR